jgi:hypothetical protein
VHVGEADSGVIGEPTGADPAKVRRGIRGCGYRSPVI